MNTPQPKTMGLTQFVHRHNDVAQYDGADEGKSGKRKSSKGPPPPLEDLKVKIRSAESAPEKVQPNSQKARDSVQNSRRNTRSQSKHKNAPNLFDDTDASNADNTSATGSTQLAKTGKPHQQHASAKVQLRGRDDDEAVGSGFAEENIPPGAARQASNGGNPNALVEHPMQGDSYPSTTSGRPSEVDQNENHATKQAYHSHSHFAQPPPVGRGRGFGRGPGVPTTNFTGPHTMMHAQPISVDEGIDDGFVYAKASSAQPLPNFSFGPGPRAPQTQGAPQPRMMPPNAQIQHHTSHYQAPVNPPEQEPHPPARLVTGEKQTNVRPPDKRHPSQEPTQPLSETGHESDFSDDRNFVQLPELKLHPLHNSGKTEYEQPHPSDPPAESDPQHPESAFHNEMAGHDYSDTAERGVVEQYSGDAQPEDEPPPFDYDPEDLFKMSYAQLKSQPFDIDPRGKKLDPELDSPTHSLHDKLAIAINFDAKRQSDFFETLDIDEWEEAGEWFLERFGDILHAIKASRRQKRKLALEFEGKIDQRHEGVTKKQKLTQTALNEMKESGGKVLQGTPKKSRKSKK
ncbi:hypothetical protein CKM354_000689600 [Cercospora kikuchii]|uniref:Extracellular mutant protein 11 C-terminal domain-containing protein n=1 Tax=Cercospora kikuchii TaxID=84275 RepID=A0A9P3FIA7_9PEZI|nr:uncharacterized protein CKM354_000689600 [Cercospora kikuchii]GIZ43679.1 hypothetical protein CKM354_000689600 [Cercospora kikuchii]